MSEVLSESELLEWAKTECNRYANGFCSTLACIRRGYGGEKPTIPVDIERAICTVHKIVLDKQALQRRVEELEQVNRSLNIQNCHLMANPPHEARG